MARQTVVVMLHLRYKIISGEWILSGEASLKIIFASLLKKRSVLRGKNMVYAKQKEFAPKVGKLFPIIEDLPSGHTTLRQRRVNVDAT